VPHQTIFFSQDIEEAVVMKQTKKYNLQRNSERERLNQNRKKTTTFKSTSDALSSILNGPKSDGKAKGGEGDNVAGDKEV
jgi:hypothetical protein